MCRLSVACIARPLFTMRGSQVGIEISRLYSILFFMKETRLNNNNSSVVYTEIQCHLVPHLFICERELKTKKNKPVRYSINRKKTQIYENNKQHPNNHKDREIDDSIFCCSMIEKFFLKLILSLVSKNLCGCCVQHSCISHTTTFKN